MKVINTQQCQSVAGGVFINPVTVMIAVRVAQIVGQRLTTAAGLGAGAVGTGVGVYLAEGE